MTEWATIPLLVLLLVTAAGAILVKDLIAAVLILGSYSFVFAIIWAWLGGVDVAFMEAVVGAGLATVFFLLTLFQVKDTRQGAERQGSGRSWMVFASLLLLGGVVLSTSSDIPALWDPASPPNAHISPIYLERSLSDTNTPNVVASVLMDYRALDTLVETGVVFTAGVACALLLWRREP